MTKVIAEPLNLDVRGERFALNSVGDLTPVLEQALRGFLGSSLEFNGEWYEPPVNLDELTKLLRANAHHESAVHCKQTTVTAGFLPGPVPVISRAHLCAAVFDYVYTGNAYLQRIVERSGKVRRLAHLHARTMRRMKEQDRYLQIQGAERVRFQPGEIIHIKKYAPESSIYGLPEYLGALKSLLLNEAGTLFRLRYYRNGAHMGFLLATMAQDVDDADVAELAKKVAEAKGLGNFKSMYIHLPDANGKVEVHGIGEFAKDDFEKIKTISRDDIISAHRVPPQILAVLTDNKVPVTGDLDKVIKLYNLNVVEPIQLDIADALNEHLSEEQRIAFEPYDLPTGAGGAPATPPT